MRSLSVGIRLLLLAAVLGPTALAQVSNDDCWNAFRLHSGPNGPFTNVGATSSSGPAWACGLNPIFNTPPGNDVWFYFTATGTGTISIDTCQGASFDTVLQVFSGTCAGLNSIGCNDDGCNSQSALSGIPVTQGTGYFLRVGGYMGATGTFNLLLQGPVAGPSATVANDEGSGAIAVDTGLNGPFSTVGATSSAPAMPCGGGGGIDVWFSCLALANGSLQAELCSLTTFDTVLQVVGGALNGPSLGCNDDNCGLQSRLTGIPVVAGTTYFIRVAGYGGATGSFSLRVSGPVASSAAAYSRQYGTGCYDSSRTFYEFFATAAAHDLAGRSMTLLYQSGRYVSQASGGWVTPSMAAVSLSLPDDGFASVSLPTPMPYPGGVTSQLEVCSNGFVSAATGNGIAYQPSAAAWHGSMAARWGNWHDFNPVAGGSVLKELVGNTLYITWNGVFDYGQMTPNFFQLQFDLFTGNVTYVWQSMSNLGNPTLVGFAGAGTSRDMGSLDLSARIPGGFETGALDQVALGLMSSGRPVTNSSIVLQTSNIPSVASIGLGILSFTYTNPGQDLASFGMPGCRQYVGFDSVTLLIPMMGSATQSLSIPNNAGLAGLVLTSQSLALVPGVNAFGAISSNGLRLLVGTQ